MCDQQAPTEPVLEHLCAAAQVPIEQGEPDVLRDVISTCRDIIERAEIALAGWGAA